MTADQWTKVTSEDREVTLVHWSAVMIVLTSGQWRWTTWSTAGQQENRYLVEYLLYLSP